MIVCHCGVVSDREIVDAIEAGARSAAAVCRATGAGRSCGTCLFSVCQLVRQHEECASTLDERAGPRTGWAGSEWTAVSREVRSATG